MGPHEEREERGREMRSCQNLVEFCRCPHPGIMKQSGLFLFDDGRQLLSTGTEGVVKWRGCSKTWTCLFEKWSESSMMSATMEHKNVQLG